MASPPSNLGVQTAAEIFTLSASSPLPIPVGRGDKGHTNGVNHDKENGGGLYGVSPPVLGTSPLGTSPREPIAPYQALPVTAVTITEHITPALPVLEPSKMTHEVRRLFQFFSPIISPHPSRHLFPPPRSSRPGSTRSSRTTKPNSKPALNTTWDIPTTSTLTTALWKASKSS